MILSHQEAVEHLGFSLRPMGKETFMVEAIPPFISENQVKEILVEMAQSLQKSIGKIDDMKRKKLVAIAARYSKQEIGKLYQRLQKVFGVAGINLCLTDDGKLSLPF